MARSISKDTLWGTGCPGPSWIKGYQISTRVQACFAPSLSYPNPETLIKALLSKDSSLSPGSQVRGAKAEWDSIHI